MKWFYLLCVIFFYKSNCFELVKGISSCIPFTFQIPAMRLFIFMNFFSLDLYTQNLNISRIWLIKTSLFFKMDCLRDQESQKWHAALLKLVKLSYFESIGLSPTINIQHDHIHKICEKVFRRIYYRKNTMVMAVFRKYEIFY